MKKTSLKKLNRKAQCALSVLSVVLLLTAGTLSGQSRKLKLGDKMPEFSATDVSEARVTYEHGKGLVNIVAFLSSDQKQSIQAAGDIKKILSDMGKHKDQMNLYVITDNLKTYSYFQTTGDDSPFIFNCLIDKDYKHWGKFGVIATPTVFISDKKDKITWMKAGYGYDFAPAMKEQLKWVLGVVDKPNDEKIAVKNLSNASKKAKIKRHIRLSKMLEGKGRTDSAIQELQKALELEPGSVDVKLRIGELYCRSGQNETAIASISGIEPKSYADQGRFDLVNGWAKRQMGQLDEAEADLIEATKHNPDSARAYFELGKVYQAKGEYEKAVEAFYTALAKIFGE